jgi:hypothetical protein
MAGLVDDWDDRSGRETGTGLVGEDEAAALNLSTLPCSHWLRHAEGTLISLALLQSVVEVGVLFVSVDVSAAS